ncbi:MAG: HAD-IIIA family hydrolase, partial [Sphaerochaeta sp.]
MNKKMHEAVLFLDRDGIIVIEDQIDSFERIIYIPGVFGALARIRKDGNFHFAMISNQDGVGTPSFSQENFDKPHQRILATLQGEGITFDDLHIDFSLPSDNCPGRKPELGMLDKYRPDEYDLDNSVVIGDRQTDVRLAYNLGCKAIWFVPSSQKNELVDDLKDTCILVSDNWHTIASFLLDDPKAKTRTASVTRNTKETEISLSVNLDGTGDGSIQTHIPF